MGCGKSRPESGAEAPGAASGSATQDVVPEANVGAQREVVISQKLVHEDGYVEMSEGTLKASPTSRVIMFCVSADHPRYQADALRRETERASGLKHPAVLKLHSSWEDDDGFHVVEELPPGRVLLEELIKHWTSFCERDAAFVASRVLDGVAYLHSKGVSHRELNVGTIYVDRGGEGGGDVRQVKIVDFSMSSIREQEDAMSLRKAEYPPYHYAPEVIVDEWKERPDQEYFAADAWAVGVLTYTLISGNPPIQNDDRRELVKRLRCGDVQWSEEVWSRFPQAKEFLGGLLTVDSDKRSKPAALEKHTWLTNLSERSEEPLKIEYSLSKYRTRTRERTLRTVVRGMTAASRMAKGMDWGKKETGAAALIAAMQPREMEDAETLTETQ
mmetsp:Transcript_16707/g.38560  ORF Transcript_16707/g.38560 Transcript_16707/m.38560 type:complete len:386 (-) Transcript_16707:11-1168(-)